MGFYVEHVLIAYQKADAAAHARPRGNLSDLYPRWLGSRELLLHGRDPYSPEITREIQIGYYGRELNPNRPYDPKDQQSFAYPVYVAFLLAPTLTLPFPVVQVAFRCFLIALVPATVLLWVFALRWRPKASTTVILLLLTLGSFPGLQGVKLQQLSVVVSALVAASVASLISGHLVLAGVILALATIKPQLTVLIADWLLLWAITKRERLGFVWGFIATLAALVLAGQLVLPGWIPRFVHGLTAYQQYTGGGRSLLDVLTTPPIGRVISAALIAGSAIFCWRLRTETADSNNFRLALALVLALTVVVVPTFAPYNQLLLLPAIFLLLQHWKAIWKSTAGRAVAVVILAVLSWPWLVSLALLILSPLVPPARLEQAWPVPLYTSFAIPLAVLAGLILHARNAAVLQPMADPAVASTHP